MPSDAASLMLDDLVGPPTCLAVLPDGRVVSGSASGPILVQHPDGGARWRLDGHIGVVRSVAVTVDGARIISGGDDGTIRIWNTATGTQIRQLTGHTGGVLSVAVTPDGFHIISSGRDGTIRSWNSETGALSVEITGHTGLIYSVETTPDGTGIVGGGDDDTIGVWRRDTGEKTATIPDVTGGVWAIAVTPDGTRLVSADRNGTVRLWDAATATKAAELTGHTGGVRSVAVSPDGTHITSGGSDGIIRIWDPAASDAPLREIATGHTRGVRSVAVNAAGTRIVTSGDSTIRIWDPATGTQTAEITGHTRGVLSVAVSADGSRIVSGGDGGTVHIWDRASGTQIREIRTGHTAVRSVAVTADATRIISCAGDSTLRMWDAESGTQIRELAAYGPSVFSVAVTSDGDRIVSGGGRDGTIRVLDTTSDSQIGEIRTGHTMVRSVAVTADGTRIITSGGDSIIRIWDTATGTQTAELAADTNAVRSVAVTADGTRIITSGGDSTIRIWDTATAAQTAELTGNTGAVLSVAVTADGARIISGGGDGAIRIWDTATGRQLVPAIAEPEPAVSALESDSASDEDRIGFAGETLALARVLASRHTATPQAIAMLGDWGSGKSSFMRQLRDAVSGIADAAPAGSPTWTSGLTQIEFNAWHYADTHLWAGLRRQLFAGLRDEVATDDRVAATLNEETRPETESRLEQLEHDIAENDRALDRINRVLDAPPWIYRFTATGRRLVSTGVGLNIAADRVRRRVTVPAVLSAVVMIIGIAVFFLAEGGSLSGAWQEGIRLAAALIALSGVVLGALSVAASWWRRALDQAVAVAPAGADLEKLRNTLIVERDERRRTAEELRLRLEGSDPEAEIRRFLEDKHRTTDYVEYDGLLGHVHRDLEQFQNHLRDLRTAYPDGHVLDRVVLYIDDLDRCEPARVVETLAAVHLMLAMDLFIVVVAVDSRWMLRCLRHHYAELLSDEDDLGTVAATPMEYLEKIFQVAYHVPGMDADGFGRLLDETLRVAPGPPPANSESRVASPPPPSSAPTVDGEAPSDPSSAVAPTGGDATAGTSLEAVAPAAAPTWEPFVRPNRPRLPTPVLEVTLAEREFLKRLAPLIDTPRSAKRVMNTYRVLRAEIPSDRVDAYVATGEHEAVLLLLAVALAQPIASPEFFARIRKLQIDALTGVVPTVPQEDPATGSDRPDEVTPDALPAPTLPVVEDLEARLRRVLPWVTCTDIAVYRRWVPRVARFSFRCGELLTAPVRFPPN